MARTCCAIAYHEAALRVRTEADYPDKWAATQNNLGVAYWNLPTGDRGENLPRIGCFEAALRVYSEADFPADWAMTQSNLGNAYLKLPIGDRAENLRAPSIITRLRSGANRGRVSGGVGRNPAQPRDGLSTATDGRHRPESAAPSPATRLRCESTPRPTFPPTGPRQHSLGVVHQNIQDDDRISNLYRAVDHYKAALRVYTEADRPEQRSLVLSGLAVGSRI